MYSIHADIYSQLTIVISDFDFQVTFRVPMSISELFGLYHKVTFGFMDILQSYYPRSTHMHNELGYWEVRKVHYLFWYYM